MLDFEGRRNEFLRCLAVTTAIAGLLPYAGINGCRDGTGRHGYVG